MVEQPAIATSVRGDSYSIVDRGLRFFAALAVHSSRA
jgi:hypothetical protein